MNKNLGMVSLVALIAVSLSACNGTGQLTANNLLTAPRTVAAL
jgi:hypothetical protein